MPRLASCLPCVTTLAGLGPAPGYLHACSLSVFTTGELEPGVTHDWLGYKSPDQMAVVERWIWIEIRFGLSLVLECRWFWIIVVVCLYYHLPDFTLHLLFLFTTLIFTTRLL